MSHLRVVSIAASGLERVADLQGLVALGIHGSVVRRVRERNIVGIESGIMIHLYHMHGSVDIGLGVEGVVPKWEATNHLVIGACQDCIRTYGNCGRDQTSFFFLSVCAITMTGDTSKVYVIRARSDGD